MHQYESSGNVRILIKAINPVTLLGIAYQIGDVVAIFENAYFVLDFVNNNKSVTQSSVNLMNYNVMNLDSIMIEPKNLSYSFYNFIGVKKLVDGNFFAPQKEELKTDSAGTVFLTRIPTNQKELFIKNTSMENVTGYTVDYSTGYITGLSNNTNYVVFYYYQETGLISYDLEKIETPYFKIEITGENNVNGISRYMMIEIPKVSINIKPRLNFTQDNLAAPDLNFKVIEGKAKVTYY
jgi:hypothetical protein